MELTRRTLIRAGAAGFGLAVAGDLASLVPRVRAAAAGTGYGRLVADTDRILDLPEGFRYQS